MTSNAARRIHRPDDDPPGAWRRNPYVAMLVLIPASVVLMASVMIPLSLQGFDGLVIDDYYKNGLHISRTMARDAAAGDMSLQAEVRLASAGETARVDIAGMLPAAGAPLTLTFAHATRGGIDVSFELEHTGGQSFVLPTPALAAGRWYVELGNESWRLLGETFHPGASRIVLRPSGT